MGLFLNLAITQKSKKTFKFNQMYRCKDSISTKNLYVQCRTQLPCILYSHFWLQLKMWPRWNVMGKVSSDFLSPKYMTLCEIAALWGEAQWENSGVSFKITLQSPSITLDQAQGHHGSFTCSSFLLLLWYCWCKSATTVQSLSWAPNHRMCAHCMQEAWG